MDEALDAVGLDVRDADPFLLDKEARQRRAAPAVLALQPDGTRYGATLRPVGRPDDGDKPFRASTPSASRQPVGSTAKSGVTIVTTSPARVPR